MNRQSSETGVAMAAALAGRDLRPRDGRRIPRLAGGMSIVGVLILVLLPRGHSLAFHVVGVGIGAALAIGGLVVMETFAGRAWSFFTARPVRWIGQRSYGVYLWHFVLMSELYFLFEGAEGYRRAYFALLPLVLVASVAAAALSFRFVERPAMRLRDAKLPRWRPGADERDAGAPGPAWLRAADPLRALAVTGIVAIHVATGAVFLSGDLLGAGGTTPAEQAFGPVGRWLLDGARVSGFLLFALTGFFVARPFVEAFVLGRERPSLRAYARHRMLRLFPAAWLALAFLYVHHGTRGASAGEVLSSLTLTEGYAPHPLQSLVGHLWLLKVGLFFYVLVPAVALLAGALLARRMTPPRRRLAVLALVALGCLASLVFAGFAAGDANAERSLPWALAGFMPGVALAALLAGRRPSWRSPRRARVVAGGAFAAGCILALLAGRADAAMPWLSNLLAAGAAGALLGAPILLETGGGGTWRWLDNRVLRWMGSRAYGIFLWHFLVMSELYPLLDGLDEPTLAFAALMPLALVGSGVAAELSWRLVERPALRLRTRRAHVRGAAHVGPEAAPAGAGAG